MDGYRGLDWGDCFLDCVLRNWYLWIWDGLGRGERDVYMERDGV